MRDIIDVIASRCQKDRDLIRFFSTCKCNVLKLRELRDKDQEVLLYIRRLLLLVSEGELRLLASLLPYIKSENVYKNSETIIRKQAEWLGIKDIDETLKKYPFCYKYVHY